VPHANIFSTRRRLHLLCDLEFVRVKGLSFNAFAQQEDLNFIVMLLDGMVAETERIKAVAA
jgi:hypothetical protein